MTSTGIFRALYRLVRVTLSTWSADRPTRMAAALAYRGIFSLIPILIISMIVVGAVFGEQAARHEVAAVLVGTLGPEAADLILAGIANTASGSRSERLIVSIVSLGALVWAATGLFFELKYALNTLWNVPYSTTRGVLNFIRNRVIALIMVLGVGFFFLSLMLINIVLSVFDVFFPLGSAQTIMWLVAFVGAATLLIALVYRYAPDVTIKWGDVWLGAAITALLLTIGLWLLARFLALSTIGSAYGAAGALVIVLIWFYYSALIFLFGAKFTHTYAVSYGSKVKPKSDVNLD